MLLYDVLARTLLFLATTVIFGADHREAHHVTFLQLKTPVIELVLRSLTAETDVGNTEMLLGGHTEMLLLLLMNITVLAVSCRVLSRVVRFFCGIL